MMIDGIPGPQTWAALKTALYYNEYANKYNSGNFWLISGTSNTTNGTGGGNSTSQTEKPDDLYTSNTTTGETSWILDIIKNFLYMTNVSSDIVDNVFFSLTLPGVKFSLSYSLQFHSNSDGVIEYNCGSWVFYTPPVSLPGTSVESQVGVEYDNGQIGGLVNVSSGKYTYEFSAKYDWTASHFALEVQFTPNSHAFTAAVKAQIDIDHWVTVAVVASAIVVASATAGTGLVPYTVTVVGAAGGTIGPEIINIADYMFSRAT
jgi:hypothetical protein